MQVSRVTAHDVLAITLRAILYYLCQNAKARQKLCDEIVQADISGELSIPVRYVEATKLSYLYVDPPRVLDRCAEPS